MLPMSPEVFVRALCTDHWNLHQLVASQHRLIAAHVVGGAMSWVLPTGKDQAVPAVQRADRDQPVVTPPEQHHTRLDGVLGSFHGGVSWLAGEVWSLRRLRDIPRGRVISYSLGERGGVCALSLVFRLPAQCGILGLCGLLILAFSEVFELSVRSELTEVAQVFFLLSLTSLRPLRCLMFFALGDFLWPPSSLRLMSFLMSELPEPSPRCF